MKTFCSACLLVGILLWTSCSGKKDSDEKSLNDCPQIATKQLVGNDSVVVLNMDLLKDTLEVRISQLLESMDIIKLDSRDTALVKGGMISASEHYILVGGSSMPCKLFDKTGKFLYQIGHIGQGPGEYTNIYSSQIDEAHNRIYLLPWTSKQLLVYDLKGNILPAIPLPYVVPKGAFHVDTDKKLLTIGMLPFQYLEGAKVLWQQDFQGNVRQDLNVGLHYAGDDYSNEVNSKRNTSEFDFYLLRWMATRDSLYHYDAEANRLKPVLTADFGTREVPKHCFTELPNYYLINITTQVVNGQAMPPASILLDKQSLKGAYCVIVNDYLGGIPIEYPFECFSEGRFLMNMDPGDLTDRLERVLARPEGLSADELDRLTKFMNSISVDDNNYVLLGKLKRDAKNLSLSAASPASAQAASASSAEKAPAAVSAEADTVWFFPFNTAALLDGANYMRANNKYKDWDPQKGKRVLVKAIAEKDGTTTDVHVVRGWDLEPKTGSLKNKKEGTCGVKELDQEAVRLIQTAKLLPGKTEKGEIVRSSFLFMIDFPSK